MFNIFAIARDWLPGWLLTENLATINARKF